MRPGWQPSQDPGPTWAIRASRRFQNRASRPHRCRGGGTGHRTEPRGSVLTLTSHGVKFPSSGAKPSDTSKNMQIRALLSRLGRLMNETNPGPTPALGTAPRPGRRGKVRVGVRPRRNRRPQAPAGARRRPQATAGDHRRPPATKREHSKITTRLDYTGLKYHPALSRRLGTSRTSEWRRRAQASGDRAKADQRSAG